MFRLGQITDPHFRAFEWLAFRPLQFLNKRAIGTFNLIVNRWRHHRMELLEDLRRDLHRRGVDHLAITGDVGNVALESEWKSALKWIQSYERPPEAVTVIPGNHDTYVEDVVEAGTFEAMFRPHQISDVPNGDAVYPFVRIREDVALLGVNSCVPTRDLGAWGQVGRAQLDRLERLLTHPEVVSRTRVVLMHHPPLVHRKGEDRNLRDRQAFADVLRRVGADLVIHGHDHRDERGYLEGPDGQRIPSVGAGSASYEGGPDRRARYNVYEIDGRSVTVVTYVHAPGEDGFHEARRELV